MLFGGNDLTAYCGNAGLLRFGDASEPYTDAPVGIMLAYAMRHDKPHWRTAVIAKAGGGTDVVSAEQSWYASDMMRLADCTTVIHLAIEFDTDPESRAEDMKRARRPKTRSGSPMAASHLIRSAEPRS